MFPQHLNFDPKKKRRVLTFLAKMLQKKPIERENGQILGKMGQNEHSGTKTHFLEKFYQK